MKSAGHLTVRQSTNPEHPPGTNIWTTPGGHEVIQYPHAPLPPEAYAITRPEPAPPPEPEEPAAREPADDTPPF